MYYTKKVKVTPKKGEVNDSTYYEYTIEIR